MRFLGIRGFMIRRFFWLGLIALAFSFPVFLKERNEQSGGMDNASPGRASHASYSTHPSQSNPNIYHPASSSTTVDTANWPANSPIPNSSHLTQGQPPVYNTMVSPAEYLSFRVTPDWIRSRWERVSVAAGEDNLTGMRVALVSGPRPADVHGSLTWYFDAKQQLQRIALRGWTGEPSELVQFVTTEYGLTQRSSQAAGLYKKTSWGKLQAFLRLDYPPVINRESSNEQLMILMEINNPASSLDVSQQNAQILASMGE